MTSGPSQDGHLHPGGAPLPQDSAAFPGRGPGGEHVIDEQDPSADRIPMKSEGSLEISPP